jgi:hypothetical protein
MEMCGRHLSILLAAVLGTSVLHADAGQVSAQRESAKAAQVATLMARHTWYLGPVPDERRGFCAGFLSEISRGGAAIRYVEPLFRTDDPDDPRLARYRDACAKPRDRPAALENYDGLWKIGERGFRVYRLDLDRNPKNGLEEIIYGEYSAETLRLQRSPGYSRIDFKECVVVGGAPVEQNLQPDGAKFANYNALIGYRDRYYVYDLFQVSADKSPHYYLRLLSLQTGEGSWCNWNTVR